MPGMLQGMSAQRSISPLPGMSAQRSLSPLPQYGALGMGWQTASTGSASVPQYSVSGGNIFDALDTNKDGVLTREEFEAAACRGRGSSRNAIGGVFRNEGSPRPGFQTRELSPLPWRCAEPTTQ